MALNVKPLWGPHYPFMHPEVTFPEKEIPLRSFTSNEPDAEKREHLKESIMDRKVREMIENAEKVRLKKLDCVA